jgi:hypothetical protein
MGHTVAPLLSPIEVEELINALGDITEPGQRGVLAVPAVAQFASSRCVLDLVRPLLTGEPQPVRAVYFDKSPGNNWLVPWHQDLTVALRTRAEVAGFGPWSVKEGVTHAQAPAELLQQMITLRLHLDHCDESNVALRARMVMAPALHLLGLTQARPALACAGTSLTCISVQINKSFEKSPKQTKHACWSLFPGQH